MLTLLDLNMKNKHYITLFESNKQFDSQEATEYINNEFNSENWDVQVNELKYYDSAHPENFQGVGKLSVSVTDNRNFKTAEEGNKIRSKLEDIVSNYFQVNNSEVTHEKMEGFH